MVHELTTSKHSFRFWRGRSGLVWMAVDGALWFIGPLDKVFRAARFLA